MKILANSNGSDYKAYAKRSDVHDPAVILSIENDPELINCKEKCFLCNAAVEEKTFGLFAQKYIDYEKSHDRKYGAKKKMRYGTVVDVLLPKSSWDNLQLIHVAKTYAEHIRSNKGIKWAAWSYVRGKAQFIRIWFCDREKFYVPKLIKPIYKKTQYVNRNTGAFCSRTDPEAVIKYKKGQAIPGAAEQNAEYTEWSEQKMRLFDGSQSNLSETRKWLLDTLIESLKEYKIEILNGLLMKRKKWKETYSRWVKRCICANNRLIRYIEQCINILWQTAKNRSSLSYRDQDMIRGDTFIGKAEIDEMKIRTPLMNKILEMWNKYSEIFKKGKFEANGTEYPLAHTRCNEVEANCTYLRSIFDQEMNNTKVAFEL
jgi:hypothetical protein